MLPVAVWNKEAAIPSPSLQDEQPRTLTELARLARKVILVRFWARVHGFLTEIRSIDGSSNSQSGTRLTFEPFMLCASSARVF